MQAQAANIQVAAKQDVKVQSQSAHIDWAAAKSVTLATAGGASITIAGGNITVQCPGTITVHASNKSFTGPQFASVGIQTMPHSQVAFDQEFVLMLDNGEAVTNRRFELQFEDGAIVKGVTDAGGKTGLKQALLPGRYRVRVLGSSES